MDVNPLTQSENFLESLNEDIIIETGQIARIFLEELGVGIKELLSLLLLLLLLLLLFLNILDILVTNVGLNANTTLIFDDIITVKLNDQSFRCELYIY